MGDDEHGERPQEWQAQGWQGVLSVTEIPVAPSAPERFAKYQVRCPHCHALLFMARRAWYGAPIDGATVAIKCWRRTCKQVIGLR